MPESRLPIASLVGVDTSESFSRTAGEGKKPGDGDRITSLRPLEGGVELEPGSMLLRLPFRTVPRRLRPRRPPFFFSSSCTISS